MRKEFVFFNVELSLGQTNYSNFNLELKFIYSMMFPHTNTFHKVQINIFLETMPLGHTVGGLEAPR